MRIFKCFVLSIFLFFSGVATADSLLPAWMFPYRIQPKTEQAKTEAPKYPNTITVYGSIDINSSKRIVDEIHQKQNGTKNVLYLAISSSGGDVSAGLRIIDAMILSKRPIYTVIVGDACSTAAWIFEFGSTRLINPHSSLMFHYISGPTTGPTIIDNGSRLNHWLQIMKNLNQQMAERTGLKMEDIERFEDREWWMLPSEAIAAKLADKVNTDFSEYPAPETDD